MQRPTVLLFDIDGTLVWTGGAGRRAIERALEAVTGAPARADFHFGGLTDRKIAREGLTRASRSPDEALIDRLLDVYVEFLVEEVARSPEYRVFEGVREALDATLGRQQFAVGLGTGNIRRGARIKLGRVDLADSFAFGGFGCDAEDRARLLQIGAERGADRLGVGRDDCRVVVIGDTPRDVDAAGRIGAECVAVATGGFTAEELLRAGATAAFPNLGAPGALEALLGA